VTPGQTFTVQNPQPVLASPVPFDPPSANVCGPDFQLKLSGTGFVSESVVQWNGTPRPTTFISPSELDAAITAADITALGQAQVTVFNPSPGGGTATHPYDIAPGPPNKVRFDPKPPQVAGSGSALDGIYENLDFGISQWEWEFRPNGSVIYFSTSAPRASRLPTAIESSAA
jgi:hypothetical protein